MNKKDFVETVILNLSVEKENDISIMSDFLNNK
jgi:hypothetical protein